MTPPEPRTGITVKVGPADPSGAHAEIFTVAISLAPDSIVTDATIFILQPWHRKIEGTFLRCGLLVSQPG